MAYILQGYGGHTELQLGIPTKVTAWKRVIKRAAATLWLKK